MSISSISSNAPAYQPPQQNGMRQNFLQLTQAVQSGDLSGAQQAYASLIQALPSQGAKAGNGAGGQSNPFQQAIQSIGSALQSGDISGAQQALQTFQRQMKGARHGHHHHGQGQAATSTLPTPGNNDADNNSSTTQSLNLLA